MFHTCQAVIGLYYSLPETTLTLFCHIHVMLACNGMGDCVHTFLHKDKNSQNKNFSNAASSEGEPKLIKINGSFSSSLQQGGGISSLNNVQKMYDTKMCIPRRKHCIQGNRNLPKTGQARIIFKQSFEWKSLCTHLFIITVV